jgi:hypothetical protein
MILECYNEIFGLLQQMIFECFDFHVFMVDSCDVAVLLFEMLQYIFFDVATYSFRCCSTYFLMLQYIFFDVALHIFVMLQHIIFDVALHIFSML